MTAVLLLEDDPELGAQVQDRLRRAGLEVTWWREGRALVEGAVPPVQLVILDLMLPGVYGLDMLRSLRAWSEVPVMVLSARNDSADKVRALQLGADDYMTKPFWPDELVERVRARLRRPALTREGVISLPGLRIDRAARSVHVGEARAELTRAEFELLAALAERCGEALTRRALAERCLDAERDGAERALDAHLSRLRKKLGPTVVIETVWGIGYRLPRRDDA